MTFIEPVAAEDASEAVAQMYDTDRASFGHVPNFTQAFSLRPGAYAAWRQLNGACAPSSPTTGRRGSRPSTSR